jgi:pyrimidine and pyridine-specific 5'-nucleotidase
MMADNIQKYFSKHLEVSDEEAGRLQEKYYKSYGLALEGLIRHHKVGTRALSMIRLT